jgi:hypothetical protein
MLKRETGRPSLLGSSHASALTATTTLGGKERRPPSARTLLETREPFIEEALAPLGDDLTWGIQARSDLVVTESLCSEENNLGSDDISIR